MLCLQNIVKQYIVLFNMIKIGTQDIKRLYAGNTEITKVYKGSQLIWEKQALN